MSKLMTGVLLLISQALCSIEVDRLQGALHQQQDPFNYPLEIKVIEGETADASVILCCHGYGGSSALADVIHSFHVVPDHLVAFNFPDYGINSRRDHSDVTFGTINELLPPLYLLKLIAVDGGADAISLYGFSAGGGAIVNMLGVLNTNEWDSHLEAVGISSADKQVILKAVQRGAVLLDAPLKSFDEVFAARADTPRDNIKLQDYLHNVMRPIDALQKWDGMTLSVALFFQNPDEVLTNRDDRLFAERLRQYNPRGRNKILISDEGGHCGFHHSLWNAYLNMCSLYLES